MEIPKEYLSEVCKIGKGNDCCRYLTVAAEGIKCAKDDPFLKPALDKRVPRMTAKGDNCSGWDSYQETLKS